MPLQYFTYFLSFFFAVILLSLFAAYLRTHELPSRTLRWGLFVSAALLVSRGVVYSVLQYRVWQKSLPYLLPPYQPTYFFNYAAFRFFSSIFLSGLIGLLLLVIFWALQRYSRGKWLGTNERLLVFFGALASGWPGAVLYAVGVFVLPLLATPWLLQKSPLPPPLKRGGDFPPFSPCGRSPEGGQKEGEGGFSDRRRRVRLAPFIIISALLAMAITPFILPSAPWLAVLVCRTCI